MNIQKKIKILYLNYRFELFAEHFFFLIFFLTHLFPPPLSSSHPPHPLPPLPPSPRQSREIFFWARFRFIFKR